MTLEKIHEITSALKRGAEVQIKVKGSRCSWTTLQLNYMLPKHGTTSLSEYSNAEIELRITEPKEPRFPTYEEVFKWFEEGKVFKHKSTKDFCKIETIRSKDDVILIKILATNFSIQQFVTYLTDKDGKSLMIID